MLLVNVVSAVLLLLVAALYLFGSIPFTNYNFLQVTHFWWLPWFIRLRPLVFAAAAIGLTATPLRPEALQPWRRRFVLAAGAVAASMAAMSVFPDALSHDVSAALCVAALAVLLAGCALDVIAHAPQLARLWDRSAPVEPSVRTAGLAGVAVASLYIAYAIVADAPGASLHPVDLAAASAVSAGLHVTLFLAAAALVAGGRAIVRRSRQRDHESLAAAVLLVGVASLVVRRVLLTALDLADWIAVPLAATIGTAVVLVWMMVRARRLADGRRGLRIAAAASVIVLGIVFLPPMVRLADWGFTLQKMLALAVWAGVATLCINLRRGPRLGFVVACVGCAIVAVAAVPVVAGAARRETAGRRVDLGLALDQYATFDSSLRAVLDIVRPMMSDREFFSTLRRIGEATAEPRPAAPLLLGDVTRHDAGPRPDIFIIVVDSLRPDYLSPYNPAVTFTPAIGAFGKESIVLRRAFTPYAGTGLSEPAIWTGGLIPRYMYPEPFEPYNNLNHLLAAEGFRRYVSVDQILGPMLGRHPDVVGLDAQIEHPDGKEDSLKYELCGTLDEVTRRLDRERPPNPVFVYTQPQNVHIRAIDTGGPHLWLKRPDADTLFAPAAAAVGRFDGCVGRFIEGLKSTGRYDHSIVVLTADHGDSYGEEGRWGHAFYVAPETLRIPLIIHVPPALLAGRTQDADQVAWVTDVTPTLFDLLGVPPVVRPGLTGRVLFPREGQAVPPRPPVQLVQSSYSRIYGLMDDEAQWLYTADANRDREEFYDLTAPGAAARSISQADRLRYERWLVEALGRLNAQFAPDFRP